MKVRIIKAPKRYKHLPPIYDYIGCYENDELVAVVCIRKEETVGVASMHFYRSEKEVFHAAKKHALPFVKQFCKTSGIERLVALKEDDTPEEIKKWTQTVQFFGFSKPVCILSASLEV